MTDKEPTQEQVKEFWERCGFMQFSYRKPICSHTPRCKSWRDPSGQVCHRTPEVDPNNLLKYAVPRLKEEYRNWKSILHDWVDELTGDYEKDALTLFWVIWEVIP